jgi:uncharacterized protein YraI
MKHPAASAFFALAIAAASFAAQAQGTPAFMARGGDLRAGPAPDYPAVTVLPRGMQVLVQGCLEDYSWCDVVAGDVRGWAEAGDLQYPYQGTVVPLSTYGTVVGIGALGFVLDDYWHRHYRERPWYRDRDSWRGRHRAWPTPRPHPPRDVRPEHPRLPQEAATIGPRRSTPEPGRRPPGLVQRPERDPQGSRQDGTDQRGEGRRDWQRDGPRGERQQR